MTPEILSEKLAKWHKDGLILSSPTVDSLTTCEIIVTTKGLLDYLKTIGKLGVFFDDTHHTNNQGLKLSTLMVFSSRQEAVAVAFVLSRLTDEQTYKRFFGQLVNVIGPINAYTFMSDMAMASYNAWVTSGCTAVKKSVCLFHVIEAWKRNKKKIKDDTKRTEIIKRLKIFANLTDRYDFEEFFDTYIAPLVNDQPTKDFGDYFQKTYCKTFPPQQWARCYMRGGEPITNNAVEHFHKHLKVDQMGGVPLFHWCQFYWHQNNNKYPSETSVGQKFDNLNVTVTQVPLS